MRKNQGITLIALIITIIIMLILVGVVVQVVIQSDLLGTAKNAGDEYKMAHEDESGMSEVVINGKKYSSVEEYMEEVNQAIVEPDNIDDWEGYTIEEDGSITLNNYKGKDIEVVFPNYVNGKPVKTIKQTRQAYITPMKKYEDANIWASQLCNSLTYCTSQETIKKVDISYGIENIGNKTFSGSQALETITIPQTVSNIGNNAFYGCKSLTEITIPSSVTTMGSNVFSAIPSITVHVPWKEGEKPEGWADDWNSTSSECTITVDYAK